MVTRNFSPHPIVAKLGDADAVKLLGYFGSTTEGIVKVYPSLDDLSVHYEIRESDILHVEEAPADELPHGGSVIWVKANATVERRSTNRTSIEARYLTGDIAARMAKGPAVSYRSYAPQGLVPETGACGGQFSLWPCSVVWGACLASNDMPCVHTKQHWCYEVATVQSCFTCAGYTCVAECYSAGCPPSQDVCTRGITICCEVYSRDVCRR
jgi:hypothetical protein